MCPVETERKIVLIHGLAGHRWLMVPLARRLAAAGFTIDNWGYPSLRQSVELHAQRLRRDLLALEAQTNLGEFHIVAHSMGAIITRTALHQLQLSKLKSVIMLCPPNHGSEVAARIAPALGWLSQPVVELSAAPGSFVRQLPADIGEHYPVGLVLAHNDFVVEPESAKLPTFDDCMTVPGLHSSMLFRQETASAVLDFVQHQQFQPVKR